MRTLLRKLPLVAFLLFATGASAQVDSVFWFAAPWVTPGHANNVPVELRLSTFGQPTTVRIQQPASVYDTTILIPANSLYSKSLSHIINTLESKPANTILDYGLKITADTLITAVYEVVSNVNNPETYSLKGQNGMGTEFLAPFQTRWNNGSYSPAPKSMICIVATENNTTVWITPKAPVVGHPANVTYSVTLQAGQTYTCENVTSAEAAPGNNLSGTVIVSDKPVSVTVSDDSVQAEYGGCRDLMGDQLVPVDVTGTEYIINKGNMFAQANEGFYVLATQNFTTVQIDDGAVSSVLLNRGDTYYYNVDSALTYVTSDRPVYMLQASGFGCELGEAILPPINCAGSDQVTFTRTNNQTFILNLLCRSADTSNFSLNGNPALIPPSAFSVVPGTGNQWSGAQITFSTAQIPSGTSNLIVNSTGYFALGVINGGSTSGCLYHYMSSFIRRVIVEVGNDTTLCNGDPLVQLSGDVREGSTTGIWTVLNGTGTFDDPEDLSAAYFPSSSDYAQGMLTFVLTSTGNCQPVSDTMRVSFIQSPVVDGTGDATFCKNNVGDIPLSGSVSFAAAASWSGGNGGAFGNSGDLSTSYTPSPADVQEDSLLLFLTSQGSFFACPNAVDTVTIYFTDAPSVSAGASQTVCAGTPSVELNGSVSGPTSTGTWSTAASGAFSPSQNDLAAEYLIGQADSAAGTVTLVLTSSNNGSCLAVSDSIVITISDRPELEITTSDSLCSNVSSIHLTGTVSPGFSAIWTADGYGTIIDPSNPDTYYTISPIDTVTGYVDLYLATNGNICPSESDSLRVWFVNPPLVDAGDDQLFCDNEAVQLNGIVTGSSPAGSWSAFGTGYFWPGPNLLSTYYFPSEDDHQAGGVTLVLTSSGAFGCDLVSDTVQIGFKPAPVAAFTATNACQNENAVFDDQTTGGNIVIWNWDFGDGDTSFVSDPLHNYDAAGNYTAQLIATADNGCSDTASQSVTIHPVPEPSFNAVLACEDTPSLLTDNSFISSGTITEWEYDFGGGNTVTGPDASYTFAEDGVYAVTLTATSALGCVESATLPVTVLSSPVADFSASPNPALILENIYFTDLTTGSPIDTWYWDFGDGEGDNNQHTIHNYGQSGDYTVTLTVTDVFGCQDTASQVISLALLPVLPTGFTPNGDGENDVFVIRGGPFEAVDFRIYNNWGEEIFATTEIDAGWDGTYQGDPAPLGVYTWTFVVQIADGKVIKKSGDVTLIR